MVKPTDRDLSKYEFMGRMMHEVEWVENMGASDFQALLDDAIARLRRLRMGGRSASLVGMSVFLWRAWDLRLSVQVDPEVLLCLSLRAALDPSIVQPEWGVILTGVLLARYMDRVAPGNRDECLGQARLFLLDLERRSDGLPAVAAAAAALLVAWDLGFPDGLAPVVTAGLAAWPRPETVRGFSDEQLQTTINEMNTRLPGSLPERDRALYRLFLERAGVWSILETASLR